MKILQKVREEHGVKNIWMQDGRIMYWDAVSGRQLHYIIIKVYSHGTAMLETERKNCVDFCFSLFLFCLCCLFLGIRCTNFFSYFCLIGKHL